MGNAMDAGNTRHRPAGGLKAWRPDTGLACRQILSSEDVVAFSDMARRHTEYFITHDLLSLPRTRAQAATWVKAGARRTYGAFGSDGECVGFCGIDHLSSLGHVFYGVAPHRCGQGVGRRIVRHAVNQYFADIGSTVALNLLVSDDNLSSQAVASAAGFRVNPFSRNLQMRFGVHPELRGFTEMTLDLERMVCIDCSQSEASDSASMAVSHEYAQVCARVSNRIESACV